MPPINVERSMSDAGNNGTMLGSEGGEFNERMRSPGARLAAYREARGWSIEQVASQLNLAPRQVQAIENDDYPALPPLAILRGFVRAYAKLLKVDAAPLLAEIGGETMVVTDLPALRRASSARFSEPRFTSITDRRRPSGKQFVLLALVVAALAAAWALWSSPNSSDALASLFGRLETEWANASGSNATPAAPSEPVGGMRSPAAEPAPGMSNDTEVRAPAFQMSEPVAPPQAVSQAATPPVAPAPPEANPAPSSQAAAPAEALVLKAHQDTWLQVKRPGSNTSIISRTVKAGETETVEIKEPVSVVIGNVSGVDATLRGRPLELKANASNNVARLSLK
jgi:cytoskeleton protein RodZ